MARKSKGRQKVDMVKMKNDSNLQVTFSKRRAGLFKKASELSTLCGTDVAVIVFSPGQKVYSFGNPSVGSVIDKYLPRNPSPSNDTDQFVDAHRVANIHNLNKELIHVESILEAEERRGEIIDQTRKEDENRHWWEAPIGELNLKQLEQLRKAMEGLKKNADSEVHKQMIEATDRQNFLDRSIFERNGPPSDVRAIGTGGFIPFGSRTSGPSASSPFGAAREIDFPTRWNLNSRASESGGSNMPRMSNPSRIHQFF